MKRAKWVTLLIAFAFAAFASSAMADTISIGLQESGVSGGAITTEASASGSAAISNLAYGTFTLNNVSGVAAPVLPEGELNTNSINVSSSSSGTLMVYVTAQGVSPAMLPASFFSSLTENSLTGPLTVTESTYVDAGNGLYALTTPLASTTFTAIGTDTVNTAAPAGLTTPFSLTAVYTITATGSGSANSTINVTAAEPGSIALLGLVLLGGLLVERKKLFA